MARLALDGTVLARGIVPGDWVALHWDWVATSSPTASSAPCAPTSATWTWSTTALTTPAPSP